MKCLIPGKSKHHPKNYLITMVIVVAAILTNAQITIIENTPHRITFTWNLDRIDTVSLSAGDKRLTSLSFPGSSISLGNEGEPILPGTAILAGVPPTGNIEVSLVPVSTGMLRLSQSPTVWQSGGKAPRQSTVAFPGAGWISKPEYTFFRMQRTARIVICPLKYDDATKTIIFLSKGSGTITFPPSAISLTATPQGDYERMLRALLINYDIAGGWRRLSSPAKKKAEVYPLASDRKQFFFRIGDGHDGINEATINENGILKITGKKIKELFGSVATGKVRLFAAAKGMLPDTLPADGTYENGVAEVPLLRFDINRDGMVDDEDYCLAYVTGASDWAAVEWSGKLEFGVDLYDDKRTYWLSAGPDNGLTMNNAPLESAPATRKRDVFLDHVQYRQSLLRRVGNSGDREWIWKSLSQRQRSFEQRLHLTDIVAGDTAWLHLRRSNQTNGQNYSLRSGAVTLCDSCQSFDSIPVTAWGDSILRISFAGSQDDPNAKMELEYFNVIYPRHLTVGDDPVVLSVLPPVEDSGVVTEFNLSISTRQKVYIFRVPTDERGIVLIDTVTRSDNGIYQWVDSVRFTSRYIICNEKGLKQLPEVTEVTRPVNSGNEVRDLRSTGNSADYLIVTHPDFIAAADSLARHKKSVGFKNPVVVNVENVYRFFSGGDKDVAAIRNFIGYARKFWRNGDALDYVVFMGVGHYDTKNFTSAFPDFIPAYIRNDENLEDYFVRTLYESDEPQLSIGRLPCTLPDQAWAMVKKIVEYEDPKAADYGEWRNRAVFVADDDMQGDRVDQVAISTPHHESSDRTMVILDSLWPSMDLRKIYMYEYEWDQARQKPGASRALINEFNNGAGYINFFGHGADVTWTDEYILTQDMVAGMNNAKRYPVITAFSCSVGRFDIPGGECLSGALAKTPGVGSIVSISSTREAYANANENLAKSYFRCLFDTAASRSVGLALIAAQALSAQDGHRTYCILGDPSIRAVRAIRSVSLQIDDADDTVAALQMLTISGSVLDNNGSVDRSFSGGGAYVAIGLFNAPDSTSRKDGGTRDIRYSLPGAPMFLGKTVLTAGTFRQTILVPQNLTFNKPGVKLTAYAWKEQLPDAATGFRGDIIFSGSISSGVMSDTAGPRISIRPVYDNDQMAGGGAAFTDRITTQIPVKCEVEIFDESGIDAAGIGPDEGVTLELEGVFARRNVNNKFQFKQGDFRRGIVSIVYEEEALKPGTYSLALTARDLVGNLSKSRFKLVLTERDDLRLDHVLNFPNPVRMGSTTRFYSHSNYTSQLYYRADVRMTIKIYSLGGRLLRVLKNARNGEVWDCRDQRGELLSPDIYLYQVMAEDYSQRKTVKSKIMKLVVLPPR